MADSSKPAKPAQRCCLGMLYYSQAMQEAGKSPVCLGLPHTPTEHVHVADNKQLPLAADFKFVCMGHALYEPAARRGSSGAQGSGSSGSSGVLPYCEGLEVVLGTQADALAAASAGAQGSVGRPPDELSAVLTSMFGGDDSPFVRGAAKFHKVAGRNWERMKTTASQAYSMTLKPLLDKLSGDQ